MVVCLRICEWIFCCHICICNDSRLNDACDPSLWEFCINFSLEIYWVSFKYWFIFFFILRFSIQVLVVQSPSPSLQIKEPPPSPGSPASETMYATAGGGTQIYMQVSFDGNFFVSSFYLLSCSLYFLIKSLESQHVIIYSWKSNHIVVVVFWEPYLNAIEAKFLYKTDVYWLKVRAIYISNCYQIYRGVNHHRWFQTKKV